MNAVHFNLYTFQMCGVARVNCNNNILMEFTAIEQTHNYNNLMCSLALCDDGNVPFGTENICLQKKCNNILYHEDMCTDYDDADSYTCKDRKINKVIRSDMKCDDICDCPECDDEAICNGFIYGHFCEMGGISTIYNDKTKYYLPSIALCDGLKDCVGGTDEDDCETDIWCNRTIVNIYRTYNMTRPLTNRTRCAPFRNNDPYCNDYLEQLNCTDNFIAKLSCQRGGYPVSIANRMLCHGIPGLELCDDGFENECVETDVGCQVYTNSNFVTK